MAIKAEQSPQRAIAEQGNYIARCYRIVQIGTYFDEMWERNTSKIRVTWELPTETHVFNPEKGEQPFVIEQEYTLSMHEKSNLRRDVQNWLGKTMTDQQAYDFDLSSLLDKYCMLQVTHFEAKNGNVYPRCGAIASVPKGMTLPEAYNPPLIWDFDNNFDVDILESFPGFIKDKIMTTIEYKDRINQLEGADLDKEMTMKVSDESPQTDLPF